MKIAKLLYWEHNPTDRRDEASSVGSIEVPQSDALKIARCWELDQNLQGAPDKFRSGHGITIVYASGRRREITA